MNLPGAVISTAAHPQEAAWGFVGAIDRVILDDTPALTYINRLRNTPMRDVLIGGGELTTNVALFLSPMKARAASISYASDVRTFAIADDLTFETFYRGDATLRTEFLSDVAQTRGVSASNTIISNAERRGSVSELFEDHALTSQGSPYISLSSAEEVAQLFARGTSGDQAGFVTVFRVPRNVAQPNFENAITWEREFLAPTRIDPAYIVRQYPVRPK
jgi:hypothetical protein